MRTPARILSFLVVCVAALAACGDNGGSPPTNSAKDLTVFSFLAAKNSLPTDVTAQIVGSTISATVPSGTDATALIATFETTGSDVTVGGVDQVSSTTANDFTRPVTYEVTAADGTTQDYTVTVSVSASGAKQLTGYAFLKAANPGLPADITATINGTAIAATVPFGTSVTALIGSFTTNGTSVTVGTTPQVSGTTPNDFTNPVTYTVTAADGTSTSYTLTVTVAPSTAKAITAYSFLAAKNAGAGIITDITGAINGTDITATVPFGTNVTALIATFTSTGASVKVGTTAQVSGTTPNNFTNPVAYTVTAADGSTATYTVTLTAAQNSAKAITAYSFLSIHNAGLPDITATITGTDIAATVPFGTPVTALIADFTTTGASVKVGGTTQVSGTTPNDFSTPVAYTVTAADGTTATYTVTVTITESSSKTITAYSFQSANNPGLGNVDATITGTDIAATVPFGTPLTALIATFSTTGTSVKVGGTTQVSGMTPNNFTAPVTYTVTAQDGTTQDYLVTLTVAPAPKDITAFSFLAGSVTATITANNITATVPFGTDPTTLVATFTTTGASVTVGGTTQVSGTTPNDFTNPVTYTVHGADGGTQDYTVTVTVALNPAKDITAFSFVLAQNAGIFISSTGTISGTSITLELTPGVNVTALVATYTTTGASVTVGGVTQTSATTPNDFTNPVTYTVTAADGTSQNYTVTVKRFITSFSFTGAAGSETTFPSDGTNAGLTGVPTMGRAGGTPSAAVNTFSGNNWFTGTINIAHYYTFTVTPAAGHTMTLTNLALKDLRSGTGPTAFSIRSSADNFATDLMVFTTHVTTIGPDVLPLGAGFANLTTAVEFRLYAYGASAAAGTWRIDEVQLSGTIAP
ncbi:MAG TPA: hypothetical protein VH165_09425 [Kofleriaceae bacterium]|jgi:hypothetical protein|nr:hypothetical protein [Kofleriaceae bacterium]